MMKRTLIVILAFVMLLSLAAYAEEPVPAEKYVNEGTWFVGAQTSIFAFTHPSIDTALYGGYFVSGGFEIGPVLTLMYRASINETDYTTSFSGDTDDLDRTETETEAYNFYGLGAQAGYFWEAKSFVVPYLMLMLEYGMYSSVDEEETKYKPDGGDSYKVTTTETSSGSGFRITPKFGGMFFLTKNFAIDGAVFLRYASMTGKTKEEYEDDNNPADEYTDEGDSTSVTSDFGFAVGMNFFFK